MSPYLEARNELRERLQRLMALSREYMELRSTPFDTAESREARLHDKLQEIRPAYQAEVQAILWDPASQQVLEAEPRLNEVWSSATQFWKMIYRETGGNDVENYRPAKTKLPPLLPTEITGQTMLEYIRELCEWLQFAGEELWGEDSPVQLPELGNRYGLGDFTQTKFVVETLADAEKLRSMWEYLAESEEYWNTVMVGASRAKLIHTAGGILHHLLHPRTEESLSTHPLGALLSGIFGKLLG